MFSKRAIVDHYTRAATWRGLLGRALLQICNAPSTLPATHLAIWPTPAIVGLKRLGDYRQLARLLGILGAAFQLIGAQHKQDVHGIRFGRRRRFTFTNVPARGKRASLIDGNDAATASTR
jgi:hypothetical protein